MTPEIRFSTTRDKLSLPAVDDETRSKLIHKESDRDDFGSFMGGWHRNEEVIT